MKKIIIKLTPIYLIVILLTIIVTTTTTNMWIGKTYHNFNNLDEVMRLTITFLYYTIGIICGLIVLVIVKLSSNINKSVKFQETNILLLKLLIGLSLLCLMPLAVLNIMFFQVAYLLSLMIDLVFICCITILLELFENGRELEEEIKDIV